MKGLLGHCGARTHPRPPHATPLIPFTRHRPFDPSTSFEPLAHAPLPLGLASCPWGARVLSVDVGEMAKETRGKVVEKGKA